MAVARQIARPVVRGDEQEETGAARGGSYRGFEVAKLVGVGDVGVVGYMLRHPTDRTVLYLLPWSTPDAGN
jgi:hypothetical protein